MLDVDLAEQAGLLSQLAPQLIELFRHGLQNLRSNRDLVRASFAGNLVLQARPLQRV